MNLVHFVSVTDIPLYRKAIETMFLNFSEESFVGPATEVFQKISTSRMSCGILIKLIDDIIASYQAWYSDTTKKLDVLCNNAHKPNKDEIGRLTAMMNQLKADRKSLEKQYRFNRALPPEEKMRIKGEIEENIRVSSEALDQIERLLSSIYIHPKVSETYGKILSSLSAEEKIYAMHDKAYRWYLDKLVPGTTRDDYMKNALDKALAETQKGSSFNKARDEIRFAVGSISSIRLKDPKDGVEYPIKEFANIGSALFKMRTDLGEHISRLKDYKRIAQDWSRKQDKVDPDEFNEAVQNVKMIMYLVEMGTTAMRDRVFAASVVISTSIPIKR